MAKVNGKVLVSVTLGMSAFLAGCGGGGGSANPAAAVPGQPAASVFGLLKPASTEAELTASLHSGLRGAGYISTNEEVLSLQGLEDALAVASPGADSAGTFSGTNLQEVGVDEADIVKYDGEVLYLVDYSFPDFVVVEDPEPELAAESSVAAPQTPIIRLFETNPDAPSATQLSEIDLETSEFSVEGLYLAEGDQGKQLIGVGQTNSFVYWELFASDYYWRNGTTQVRSWNVDDTSAPVDAWRVEIEGSLLSSRRIGDMLYLVTRYSPAIEGLISYPQTDEEVIANQDLVDNTALEDLLPNVQRDGGVSTELLSATDCLIPNQDYEGSSIPPGQGSLITVTAIDLTSPYSMQSVCLNTYASGFYASTEAIYVTANLSTNTTLIHKIQLTSSGPQYRGSGEVPGYIGTSNPSFLMSEYEGDLRVVSSTWEDRFFPLPVIEPEVIEPAPELVEEDFGRHRLTVLRESADGTKLEQIAQLPNDSRPERIGKPDENIFSARFVGDRAYVVTFRVIDPLYVIDLRNPEDPQITGELEIPGFSTLLQPVGENLLLGVGHDVPVTGENIIQGVKLALFDVGNISAPVSLGEVVIGKRGSYSPALVNHHSLTLLEVEGKYRAAIPIERYAAEADQSEGEEQAFAYYGWSDSGLYLFDIDPVGGTLSQAGTVIVDQASSDKPYSNFGIYNGRSVLHEEAVFFINGGTVWSSLWGQDQNFSNQ
ncbi:MAG: hypothetical protein ACI9J0_001489 [Cryomorphaceae bacterium]|jgi:hypothetical protein